jgi:hypothetical protein
MNSKALAVAKRPSLHPGGEQDRLVTQAVERDLAPSRLRWLRPLHLFPRALRSNHRLIIVTSTPILAKNLRVEQPLGWQSGE